MENERVLSNKDERGYVAFKSVGACLFVQCVCVCVCVCVRACVRACVCV